MSDLGEYRILQILPNVYTGHDKNNYCKDVVRTKYLITCQNVNYPLGRVTIECEEIPYNAIVGDRVQLYNDIFPYIKHVYPEIIEDIKEVSE